MDDENLQAWLEMGERQTSLQLHMQLTADEMADFLIERGVVCEAESQESMLYAITTTSLAAVYCMANLEPDHDRQFVRSEADKLVAELGEFHSPPWDELLNRYFGGDKTQARFSELDKHRVKSRYERNVKHVLGLMYEMGFRDDLNPDEIKMVIEVVKAMDLRQQGLDAPDLQEELRLKVLSSDLDREFWTELVDVIFM